MHMQVTPPGVKINYSRRDRSCALYVTMSTCGHVQTYGEFSL
ncbi:hypothetical protein BS78_K054700 [Paspalum vaginatum]|uniref:Uncharacterized protein n=1 Tax=Paspalum vaginatum TaxID=158149 RepID=A0A9W7XA86_9POAL|nr:hypothetical protein BS78_K054700 [Paspalum vaginatum]